MCAIPEEEEEEEEEERFRNTKRDVFKNCSCHVSIARFAELRAFREPGGRACDAARATVLEV